MNKSKKLLQDTLRIAEDYEKYGHSERTLRQCEEQQEYYTMVNQAHREMINRWKEVTDGD